MKNGLADEDGCPDETPDSDGDGVPDHKDRCVAEAEDKDGHKDEDGCPDPDDDGDGVADVKDACPQEAGAPENPAALFCAPRQRGQRERGPR